MLGPWPLKDQNHCDRLTVPALNQGGGKSSRWMKSPRCKVKIPRRRKRSSALQESSGLTFSKLDVHSTNWRCPEPMRNPFCPLISSLFCTHPSSKVGLVLEGSKLEGKLGREDFPQNSQSCTFLFPTEIAEEEDGVCGIGPIMLPASCLPSITRCPCARVEACRVPSRRACSDATYFLPQTFLQGINLISDLAKKSFVMHVKRIIV